MRDRPTNPVDYLRGIGVESVFRFILTHPDMDHMDGLAALADAFPIANFWDSGVRREDPPFEEGGCPYREGDWDCYKQLRDGRVPGANVVSPRAGSRFQFANEGPGNGMGDDGDGINILAPSAGLVRSASSSGDVNDGSYVLACETSGGMVVFGGDAHDDTWEHIITNYRGVVENCAVLIAPHHGRDSGRSYRFLDVLRPRLTVFGQAPSEHLAYDAWRNRGLRVITSNQAGNVILEETLGWIDVWIENAKFAARAGCDHRAANGYYYLGSATGSASGGG
jgi:beta-lactamase superfamily II metal-dependent hydrolase